MSMNLLTLVHQNVPDRCSSRHVLNQNVVTQGSCLGVLLSGWDEDLGLGVRAVFTWVGVALLSGKEKKKRCLQDGTTRGWNPESLMASLLEKHLFKWSCLHLLEIEHIYCISIENIFWSSTCTLFTYLFMECVDFK